MVRDPNDGARPAQIRFVSELPVTQIREDHHNPVEVSEKEQAGWDTRVKAMGRLPEGQWLLVRREGNTHVVVRGAHLLRAAIKAGLTRVACEVIKGDGAAGG